MFLPSSSSNSKPSRRTQNGPPKAKVTKPEVYDLCGVPLLPGSHTKPVGPERKIYHRVSSTSRSQSVPLTGAAGAGAGAAAAKSKKENFRMKGLDRGWYSTTLEASVVGPYVTNFQRAGQMDRELIYTPQIKRETSVARALRHQESAHQPMPGTGNSFLSPSAVVGREEDWSDVPRGVCIPSVATTTTNPIPEGSGSPQKKHSRHGPGIVRSNIFGTLDMLDEKELARREKIRQQNIISTRRLRAGIPEPVPCIQETIERVMKEEEAKHRMMPDQQQQQGPTSTETSIAPVTGFAHVPIEKSLPFQRQMQGRTVKDVRNMEAELARCMGQLSAQELSSVVPTYRTKGYRRRASDSSSVPQASVPRRESDLF